MSRRALAVVILAFVAADWTTKFLVQNHLDLYSSTRVLGEWLTFHHTENPGASTGILADLPDPIRLPVLATLAIAGMWVCATVLRRATDRWTRLAAALVLAGAAGNLGDRLLDGAVTDFILVRYFPYVFNVADIAVCAGALLLALRMAQGADTGPAPGSAAPA